ncbi:MAG: HAD family hydrolase [Oscillospiraceae bacterium]|nr:HAD family hydrolase [Oscillospiraceae bacterium]
MLKGVFFDLDGTLLPMDQDEFVNGYFGFLCKKMEPYGYEAKSLVKAIWGGTGAMVKNDGSCTNEEAFWNFFCSIYGPDARKHIPLFEEFYAVDFQKAKQFCGFNPMAAEVVAQCKAAGKRVVLATNPLFPQIATRSRIGWAGLKPEDFELFTAYEDSRTCKPNPDYYREVLQRTGLKAEECLMIGNDAAEDMVAETLGMKVFLLTDCLINKAGADLDRWPHGSFEDLKIYLQKLFKEE